MTANSITVDNMKFGWRHVWIVSVSSLGQMIGTAVATLASVIIPMIQILGHPELKSWQQGLMGAADLIGIAIGSVIIGKLSESEGYLKYFRICPAVMLLASLGGIIFPNVWLTTLFLFIIGFAIGGEYSLDSDYVSELMPTKWRSTMVGVTKAASAMGNIIVAAIAWLIIMHFKTAECWPKMMWILAAISLIMILARIHFAPSPKWLIEHGRIDEAKRAVKFFLGNNVSINPELFKKQPVNKEQISLGEFIRTNLKKVILTGVPWACEGLGVYGIGVFLPILVLALGIVKDPADMPAILHVANSVKITLWISCIILPGFIIGLVLIRKLTSVFQLAWGFYLSGGMLILLLLSYHLKWDAWISIGSFMLFELFLNIGPHLLTYVLPSEVYDVRNRSLGSGLAAGMGKVGAVLAVFFIPILLKAGGVLLVLAVSIAVMFIGGIVTSALGPKVFKNLSD